jgi:hypothetical protein
MFFCSVITLLSKRYEMLAAYQTAHTLSLKTNKAHSFSLRRDESEATYRDIHKKTTKIAYPSGGHKLFDASALYSPFKPNVS